MICNNFFFSYWDWLPIEIQLYIIQLAIAQYEFEQWMRRKLEIIHKELIQIKRLNEMWNTPLINGLVTLKISKCSRYYCKSRVKCSFYKKAIPSAHYYVVAYNVDENNVKQKNFLGHDYSEAKGRINHVKSFL